MDYSSKSKNTLKLLADHLGIDVDSKKRNKPTVDELVVALESFEDQELVATAFEELGLSDDNAEVEDTTDDNAEGQVVTYVGKGESSPPRINFMGQQEFIKGRPTKVSNGLLFSKIQYNPTFVMGEAEPELLQQIEDEGLAVAEANRKADRLMDQQFKRVHGGKGD